MPYGPLQEGFGLNADLPPSHKGSRCLGETCHFYQAEICKRKTTPISVPTYDGIPSENVSIENVKGQVPETPRDFTVKVFSVKGARQTDRTHVVRMQVDDESSQRLTCPGDGLEKVRELNGSGRRGVSLIKPSPAHLSTRNGNLQAVTEL